MDFSNYLKRGPVIRGTIETVPSSSRNAFIQILFPPVVIIAGFYIGGLANWIWLFFMPIGPYFDYIGGRDQRNPAASIEATLSNDKFYRYVTYAAVPMQYAFVAWGLWAFTQPTALYEKIGLVLGLGFICGSVGITIAHELVHRKEKLERVLGGLLLASVSYATFKIEHVYGHHVHVSTPEDASTSKLGQSLYAFLPQAIFRNVRNGFRLAAKNMVRKGLSPWSVRNEMIWWTLLSASFYGFAYLYAGTVGLIYFLVCSLMAITALEIVNYIEHYGLVREKLPNGKYERVTHWHSWNASERMSNLMMLNLQRHSDHHAYPNRRYQILRHFDDSPQLPFGYDGMMVLALFPPLWRKVMDPKVMEYREKLAKIREEKAMVGQAI